ncbi:folylpolyglutamate synthase isoform X2 [Eucalyptus grandis]|uniref:folylpolyglutamate synthase isoform X2 n=1 Tax=Eucalyptus grandis TaxID=71139 RepID=UPI00192EBE3D|nr:folylpolyglutamate synthase isoform X2 [Eucalyptus grandis]
MEKEQETATMFPTKLGEMGWWGPPYNPRGRSLSRESHSSQSTRGRTTNHHVGFLHSQPYLYGEAVHATGRGTGGDKTRNKKWRPKVGEPSFRDNASRGWHSLMLAHTVVYLKCGIFGFSHFRRESHLLSGKAAWRLSDFPASGLSQNLKVPRSRYTKMSLQVIEKMENDLAFKRNQDLPLSSSYEAAMEALSSLITRQKRGDRTPVGGKFGKLERMSMYLRILGLEEKIAGLKIIHVAGTKGKGSTCAFCEAILRECGFRTGLFTSPHLIDVRERFRLDGLDVSEDKFLLYFWDCWSQLKENVSEDLPMPPLFQFLTILAFNMFISEQVDVAIIEVGLGGTKDSTNVIKEPVVCGITSLGMDHTESLGDTLGQIASHKAGIFKPQIPAFTVPQLSEAMDVLEETAGGLTVPLQVAVPLDIQRWGGETLSLSGDHQLVNAGLAVSLCKCWLQRTGNWEKLLEKDEEVVGSELPPAFVRGLSTARLSGRAQIVHDTPLMLNGSADTSENSGELTFYLDGAHSPESMEACARWFSGAAKANKTLLPLSSPPSTSFDVRNMKSFWGNGCLNYEKDCVNSSNKMSKQILLFNCMDVRDPQILLPRLVNICGSSGTHFSKALFVPSMSTYSKVTSGTSVITSDVPTNRDLSWQYNLQRIWEKIIHGKDVSHDKSSKTDGVDFLPPHKFLYEDVSNCNPADRNFACSAVMPSLPLTIKWLRDCVKENPSLRLQVLVTGSLHLVGDVLKLLRSTQSQIDD